MKAIPSWLQVFQSRKMAALLLLGFSAGLPLYLTGSTLQPWMKAEGVRLGTIGLFSLAGLPYSLKFLWSPLLDRFVPPFLGRRRGWLVITQIALIVAIAALALQKPAPAPLDFKVPSSVFEQLKLLFVVIQQTLSYPPLLLLFLNALLIALLSATQDIAIDAYRADVLEKPELGAGVAIYVLGYRIALTITGSLALILAAFIPWPTVFLLISILMLIGVGASIFAPEPVLDENRPSSLVDAVILPFREFLQRNGLLQSVFIVLFIVLYKFGDSLLANMSTPFLLDIKFSEADIGWMRGMGIWASIVGTLAGGAVLSKIGINRSLWVFGGLQALTNLGYFALAQVGNNYQLFVLTINLENFCGGLGTAAFVAFLMSLCNQRFSATQFALLSSLMAFSRDILVAPAGFIAEATGVKVNGTEVEANWPLFFLITIAVALPGLALLPVFAPWNSKPALTPRPGLDDTADN